MTQPGRSTGSSTGTQTGKAVLVIAVVVVVGWWVLLKGTPSSHVASTTSTTHATTTIRPATPPTTAAAALIPPSSIKLQVLNGVLTGSLAGTWSAKLKANPGYNTLPPDNATAKVAASVIYVITPGYRPRGQRPGCRGRLAGDGGQHHGPGPVQRPHPGRRAHHREPGLDRRP